MDAKMQRNSLPISKEPWLAINLSMFLAGIGQIYSGRIRRGCVLIFIKAVLTSCATWFIFSFTGRIIIGAGFVLLLGIVHIWNLFDAYKCAKKANTEDFEISRKENKDPWLAVFLSRLIPGLGQLYIKEWAFGVVFIICFVAFMAVKKTYMSFSLGLGAVFLAFVCYHAYVFSPVRREVSKRWILSITLIILCWELLDYMAIPSKKYFVEAFKMTPCSMRPTLVKGDRFLVRKFSKYLPKRGDIVVFKSPNDPHIPYAMRAVGFGGETIEIKDKSIYIDGEKVKSPPFQDIEYVSMGQFGAEGKAFVVPDKSLFVFGDHSSKSFDSRFYGAIPESDLIGKAYKIYWPPSRMGPIR